VNFGVAELRNNIADVLNVVIYQGERVILERRGKEVAAIVSLEDLAVLQAIEDRGDVKVARQRIAELKRQQKKPLSLNEIKEQLEL